MTMEETELSVTSGAQGLGTRLASGLDTRLLM